MGGSIRLVKPSPRPTVGVAVTCELDSGSPGGPPDVDGYWGQLDQMLKMDVPVVHSTNH